MTASSSAESSPPEPPPQASPPPPPQASPPQASPPPPSASAASSGRSSILASIVLGLTVVALGYFSFQAWARGRELESALASTSDELSRARGEASSRGNDLAAAEQKSADADAKLTELDEKLRAIGGELAAAQSRLEELDEERAASAERLAEFQRMTEQFRKMIDGGKLEIAFRRGRMIVQLPAQVLFPSGSADLTDEGREALVEVAKILRGMRNQHFIVGGHTDTVPVSNERFRNNWELSTARAVHVTEALIKAGLSPRQLVAAGYAEFDPVARNNKEAGRQKNRRIEIILEPKLREIPELESIEAKAP